MKISFHKILLQKRFPLKISRFISASCYNVFVRVEKDGIVGWGESVPGEKGAINAEQIISELEKLIQTNIIDKSISEIESISRELKISPGSYAGLDIALWDWKAKKANMPLHSLLGLPVPTTKTSLTVGIMPPESVKKRVPLLFDNSSAKYLKIKLGSPEGIDADKKMYEQVLESSKEYNLGLRVDANGGWNTENAKHMIEWLSKRHCDYVEQPIAEGEEKDLKTLYENRMLPIFVDESCRFSQNIIEYSDWVDGVNLKLMKSGGITEGLRVLATAKAFSLETMIGCMSESSISISAAASISGNIDHIDLDSHYNLNPDPASGAEMIDGVTMPRIAPGHGAFLSNENKI
jgi:L-alanine-DL-glutamate epimerase-like enolase superfamily enzyme|tara:strand:+ start:543 stop:1589 length:1047 start_codon:yes stop_codon:yes gene_type:complete